MSKISKFDRMNHLRHQFEAAFSTMAIHNHLNNAYQEAGLYHFAPHRTLMWCIPSVMVPRRVHKQIDATSVILELRSRLETAQKIIDEHRESLDMTMSTIINHIEGRSGRSYPYHHLFPGITVEPSGRPTYECAWEYTFNPHQVAIAMVEDFDRFVEMIMRRRRLSDFSKLCRIHGKAKYYESSASLVADTFYRRM